MEWDSVRHEENWKAAYFFIGLVVTMAITLIMGRVYKKGLSHIIAMALPIIIIPVMFGLGALLFW